MKKVETMSTINRRVAQKIRRLSPEQAREMLARIRAEGYTIEHPDIAELTGGHQGQSLNAAVTRRLAVRAGMLQR